MINNKKVMAFIPARGGSKRLPHKNILPLAGQPLISWSIEAAQNSQYIDDIFVSTDDADIAEVSTSYGVKIPELRPSHLATDEASTESVITYTLDKFGKDIDIIVLLQPTSPLRNAQHIDTALEMYIEKNAFSIVSVTPCEHSPLWANTLPKNHSMGNFIRPESLKRSQELNTFYRINGAIYIFDAKKLMEYGEIRYTPESYAFIMDPIHSVDIDQSIDFSFAELLIHQGKNLAE
ncbi:MULTISPECIES: cytidylyltransferase domain-containing protein [Providencia]|nr:MULTISPECIES: acylneuraminate cytidylyltransferase family protein [Providencia]EJD6508751.1 acylneuraminate cytidylyltransferase family protein [Providencia rettgeri]MBQ0317647.1 acylneuraminate cytidylyltransferase family protein [Providencia rettgeri]MBQ0326154.1 acylneuraminate cytidylyltransferase family protein [Providencia rettgeri]MBQ0351819.1 acylneuraminate cytidylyltransferase family protein [Providencia rettgeri]MBQ0405072.1 acylneuraminate cytidylyltransferase family protein [Pr